MFTIRFKGRFQKELKFKSYGDQNNVVWDSDIIRPRIKENKIYIGNTMMKKKN